MNEEKDNELTVNIANLSFTVNTMEEVGLSKIFNKKPYGDKPNAYSVMWSEWVKDAEGANIQAKIGAQTYKNKMIQKFDTYEAARVFFLKKVNDISLLYNEGDGAKK